MPEHDAKPPWVEQTTHYWQHIDAEHDWIGKMEPPWHFGVPVRLHGGGILVLPIRPLKDQQDRAVASLIANQASLSVAQTLGARMTELASNYRADYIIGMPTLGFVFAPLIADGLGHSRWIPLGYSRKFWYEQALSTSVRSITSPDAGKAIYLDPNLLRLIRGRSVLLIDDAISSGRTMAPVWDFLVGLGVTVSGAVVAMRQGTAAAEMLGTERFSRVGSVFDSPLLTLRTDGWWPMG